MSTPQGNETTVQIADNANSTITYDNSSITYRKYDRDIRKKVLFWCNLVVFLVALGICVASFTIPSLQKATPSGIEMWQWSLLATALLCGPLLSKILHYMFIFIDTKFGVAAARENVIYYIVELIESAWVVLWFSIILVAWLWVVDEPSYLGMVEGQNEKIKKKFAKTFSFITVTLITLIIGSFVWLLKDLVLLMAKSSFHISKFFDRVNDALMHQHVINRLTPRVDDKYDIGNACQPMCHWKEVMPSLNDQVNQKNVSSWGMQKVIDWFFDNKNLTYKLVNGEDKKIESENDAIEGAEYIFSLLSQNENHMNRIKVYIKETEVQPKDQVSAVLYRLVDEKITKDDLTELMVKAYKYRETLASALKANRKLFEALNRFIEALLVFFIFALWLMMIGVETRKVIIVIGTAIVGSTVIIGDTCKKLLDCLLFVFVVHPFDIGDCCLIDESVVTIKRIQILTTIALTLDNETRYYPNTDLAEKCISNYTRSREMGDFVEFYPETDKPIEDIEQKIKSCITNNPLYWRKEYHLVMELMDENKVKMRLHFKHTINPHDFEERQNRKSKLVLQIRKILQE